MAQSQKSRSEAAKKAAATRKRNAKKQEEPQVDSTRGRARETAEASPPVRKTVPPDQQAQELEREQRVHAQRTGGGEVKLGGLEAQRQAHNKRTGDTSR